jgi:hypothetical protein
VNDTQIINPAIEDYVTSVGRFLAGLDADERAALLEDVREHASSVLAEQPDIDLVDRLGSPQAYARDLLDGAGITAAATKPNTSLADRFAQLRSGRAGDLARRIRNDFSPLWAAARGVAAVWVVSRLFDGGPSIGLPILLSAGAVAGWLLDDAYTRVIRDGMFRRSLGWAVNIVTAFVVASLVLGWAGSFGPKDVPYVPLGLTLDNAPVSGIQAFGPDGKPIPVSLFDAYGAPLIADGSGTENLTCPDPTTAVSVPYLNAAGQPIPNAHPARGVCVDGDNVVVADATPVTNGATVQTWTTNGIPQVGLAIVVDEDGSYAGIASPTAPAPSSSAATPTPSGSAKPTASLVAPSASVRR